MNTTQHETSHESAELIDAARENLMRAGANIQKFDQRMQRFARQQPVAAAFAALTVGFLVGRFVAKRL
ncbi:MAG TPA: hypothetical protein VH142_11060 [Polyangiaceae bacterium]|jgi:hypothetical protein|nr:hypothetical protein [Polyangiaceae bacterium]